MSRGRGFTLVELLIVIAIIALLATMIAPSLGTARELARRAVCASNLHNIGSATAAYLDDFAGMLPTSYDIFDSYNRWGGKNGTACGWGHGWIDPNDRFRMINAYVGWKAEAPNADEVLLVFRCPSDNGALPGFYNQTRMPTHFDWTGTSYWYNSSANRNSSMGLHGRKLVHIPNPSWVINATDWSFRVFFNGWDPFQYAYWHNDTELGWGNILLLDGSVVYRCSAPAGTFTGPDWTFDYSGPHPAGP